MKLVCVHSDSVDTIVEIRTDCKPMEIYRPLIIFLDSSCTGLQKNEQITDKYKF